MEDRHLPSRMENMVAGLAKLFTEEYGDREPGELATLVMSKIGEASKNNYHGFLMVPKILIKHTKKYL